jgi:hypothetical protein
MSNNTSLQDVFAKAHKYREPKSINWKHNLKILMDYARANDSSRKGHLTISSFLIPSGLKSL